MANFVYTLSKDDVNLATRCFQYMLLDGAPHLIDMIAEGKVFNF